MVYPRFCPLTVSYLRAQLIFFTTGWGKGELKVTPLYCFYSSRVEKKVEMKPQYFTHLTAPTL